jgi:hypothetical protein
MRWAFNKTPRTTVYDDLRRARQGQLRHHDHRGLTTLLDDYYAHADELEVVGPPTVPERGNRRAA